MNKVKKFEISVVDRTYSKIVSNLVKFYSSDSALEVIFILAEEGYEFDSAELVLSNTDGSLITRPLTKVPEGYSYEFEKNIISHHGEWKGQVVLYSDDDTYVSSKILITIEDDLLSERPPKLTDVYSWTSLKRYADDLVDELKQAVLSVEGIEDTFNANELERQTTFETNESERNETFEINETTRQQAETQRASAESSRVSAEEQRKIDHVNRSAELDGKTDKVVIKNIVENGDFSDGTTGWTIQSAATVTVDTTYSATKLKVVSASTFVGIIQNKLFIDGNLIYASFIGCGDVSAQITVGNTELGRFTMTATPKRYSILKPWAVVAMDRIGLYNIGIGTNYYGCFVVIDLTATFGAGNEPTKEEMDELIKVTGYIDGEYAINNKDMLGHLLKSISEKANKKQEDWIAVPLFNGVENGNSPLKVMKDEMGIVHFKGSLTNLRTGSKAFSVPFEYRPDIGATEGRIRIPVSLNMGRELNSVQINYVGDGYINNPNAEQVANFDGVSYVAKRG